MLHGISEYSPSGLNLAESPKDAFLKSVEYGCLPSAEWYCTPVSPELDSRYYYDSNINDAVSFYIKANDALCDLRGARITSHEKIQDGFFCTEYNNSSRVYVNYSDKPVTINGITVAPKDCMRIS